MACVQLIMGWLRSSHGTEPSTNERDLIKHLYVFLHTHTHTHTDADAS